MEQAVKAVIEHPNISKSDSAKLDVFCRMFELDWRGDRSLENKSEFLATNPVYFSDKDKSTSEGYGQIGNFEVTNMIRYACQPYVEDLTASLIKSASS